LEEVEQQLVLLQTFHLEHLIYELVLVVQDVELDCLFEEECWESFVVVYYLNLELEILRKDCLGDLGPVGPVG
jgi:hypothetical protein